MHLSEQDTFLLQNLISNLYSRDFSQELLVKQSDIVCEFLDSHYFAVILFPNDISNQRIYLSNNSEEFNSLYSELQEKDVLMHELVNNNQPVLYSDQMRQDESRNSFFYSELQKIRPVSDCFYVPINANGYLAGFAAIGRAGLNNSIYDSNDLLKFRFAVNLLQESFLRSFKLSDIAEDQAVLNGMFQVISAGSHIKDILKKVFGSQYWDNPGSGTSANCVAFLDAVQRFSSGIHEPSAGSLSFSIGEQSIKMHLKRIPGNDLRQHFLREPQFTIVLEKSNSISNYITDFSRFEKLYKFTPREKDVVMLIYKGLTNSQIAAKLRIAESTVKQHVWNIFNKTGADNRTSLVFKLSN